MSDLVTKTSLIVEKRVRFQDIQTQEVDAFVIIPSNFNTAEQDLFSAFSTTNSKSLRRFELVLKFLSKFSKLRKIGEILEVVQGIQADPELKKRTIILTPNYILVKTRFR